jgi:hypothetical protein
MTFADNSSGSITIFKYIPVCDSYSWSVIDWPGGRHMNAVEVLKKTVLSSATFDQIKATGS